MKLSASDYLDAALEHLELAQRAYQDHKEYMVAYYFSGVAVESVLRAYLFARGQAWYSRHGIRELAKASRFLDLVPVSAEEDWGSRLSELNLRWRSENRYCSERALRRYLIGSGLDRPEYLPRGIRGNLLKYNARRVLELAEDMVGLGKVRWNLFRR